MAIPGDGDVGTSMTGAASWSHVAFAVDLVVAPVLPVALLEALGLAGGLGGRRSRGLRFSDSSHW